MKKLSTILIAILIFLYVPITPSIEAASKLQRHAASVTKTVGEYKFKVTVSPTFNTSSAIYTSQMIVTKRTENL